MLIAPVNNVKLPNNYKFNNKTTQNKNCCGYNLKQKYDSVSFSGNLHLKQYNPAYKFCMRLFERSRIASRRRFSPPIDDLKGKLNEVFIPINGHRKIMAYDINPNNTDKYVLFFHGSSQNITNCQMLYKEILDANYAVLAPEYSGFGRNKSMYANEFTLQDDIEGIIKYIQTKKKIKNKNLGIAGHSLGGFAATSVAEQIPDAAFVVLISPINSLSYEVENIVKNKKFKIPKIFQYIYKRYPKILNPLEKIFKTEERIGNCKVPLYIIHSANDNMIPVKSSKSLACKSKSLRELIILPDGGHRLSGSKLEALRDILNKNNNYLPIQ